MQCQDVPSIIKLLVTKIERLLLNFEQSGEPCAVYYVPALSRRLSTCDFASYLRCGIFVIVFLYWFGFICSPGKVSSLTRSECGQSML